MYRLFISLRYLRRRFTALAAVLAVTFGVATLLTVLSIMEGYIVRLREMIREQESHIIVFSRPPVRLCGLAGIEKEIRNIPHVKATSPFIESVALYSSGKFNPCFLRGMDPGKELRVTSLGKFLFRTEELRAILSAGEGIEDWDKKKAREEEKASEILSDKERNPLKADEAEALFSLAWRREIFEKENPRLKDRFRNRPTPSAVVVGIHVLTSRNLSPGQIVKIMTIAPSTSQPVSGNFVVTGAFKTGNYDIDSQAFLILVNRMTTFLETYNPQLNEDCYSGIRVALDDYGYVEDVRSAIKKVLQGMPPATGGPDADVETWEEQKRIFLQAVAIEKWIVGFIVSLLNVFTGCIILLMLVLIVIEKTRDSGILLAMGATPRGVFSIFLLNGLVISILGTLLGLGIGALFVDRINDIHDLIYRWTGYRLFDPEVYLMDRIPTVITIEDVLVSMLPAIGFGLIASLIPAAWAARKDPIQSIHYE